MDKPHSFSYPRNDSPSDFEQIINRAMDRRRFLAGSGAALGLMLSGASLARVLADTDGTAAGSTLLHFQAVPASTADRFIVPTGYEARPLIMWGEPLLPGAPAFDESGTAPAADQALQMGDNNDGMSLFPLGQDHALLVVNNEYSNRQFLFDHGGQQANSADDTLKDHHAHGISLFEIRRQADGYWRPVPDAPLNRRITVQSPMHISGPAAGHPLLRTVADPEGVRCLGTFGNCANGETPWGTYLTCEENTEDYFAASADFEPTPAQRRYGLSTADEYSRQWYPHDERFDLSQHPNEPHRHGWIVEIDPMNPDSVPVKRTALGRFSHENAALTVNHDGRIVIYSGDDARGEHIYRFVSDEAWRPDDAAANRNLLDHGTLYVARFDAEEGALQGPGKWLALRWGENGLTPENGFHSQADVLIHARLAATVAGATTMDRPEWIAVHPRQDMVLCTLTNNRYRGVREEQPLNGPNPRSNNHYGQIVRWRPANGDHAAADFEWDLFVVAGNPTLHDSGLEAGSANLNADNMFNGPDGLAFDADGRLWIQTDGNYSDAELFAGMGNNQMLCADPDTGEIRRFAVGPRGCELTGITFSADRRTLFVGVQHPGEGGTGSDFPLGEGRKPRSTIMMIRKHDGGVIGSA
ncbi:MAG: PhoX family phosphatase [Gammaproteobacteria bacterium]|nr:MAG: PhoX family phosphatase [Gammaproteobacteria bacterium]